LTTQSILPNTLRIRGSKSPRKNSSSTHGARKLTNTKLISAHIGGQLHLSRATFINDTGPALQADRLTVDDHAFFDGFSAKGHGEEGAVLLPGTHVGGQLHFRGTRIENDAGSALTADRLTVNDHAIFDSLDVKSTGEPGAVRLYGAHIVGHLYFRGGTITNYIGPAVAADGLTVDGDVNFHNKVTDKGYFVNPVTAIGSGNQGAVRMIGAHIGGRLLLGHASFNNDTGPRSTPTV